MPRKRTRKLSDKQYRERLKFIRPFNKFGFDLRHKLIPQRKSAITRAYNKNKLVYESLPTQAERVDGPRFAFLAGKGVKLKKLKGISELTTNKGAFFSTKHSARDPKVKLNQWKFNKQGDLEVRVRGRRQIFIPVDAKFFVGKTDAQQRKFLNKMLAKYGLDDPLKSPLYQISFHLGGNETESFTDVDIFIDRWLQLYASKARNSGQGDSKDFPVTGFNIYTYDVSGTEILK